MHDFTTSRNVHEVTTSRNVREFTALWFPLDSSLASSTPIAHYTGSKQMSISARGGGPEYWIKVTSNWSMLLQYINNLFAIYLISSSSHMAPRLLYPANTMRFRYNSVPRVTRRPYPDFQRKPPIAYPELLRLKTKPRAMRP